MNGSEAEAFMRSIWFTSQRYLDCISRMDGNFAVGWEFRQTWINVFRSTNGDMINSDVNVLLLPAVKRDQINS